MRFVAGRLLGGLVTLVVVSMAAFVLLYAGANPTGDVQVQVACAPGQAPDALPDGCSRTFDVVHGYLVVVVGADRPGLGLLGGDLGATGLGGPVADVLGPRVVPTVVLIAGATALALLVSAALALVGGRRRTVASAAAESGSLLAFAVPSFVVALLIQATVIAIFTSTGELVLPTGGQAEDGAGLFAQARYAVLPVVTLALTFVAGWSRYTRGTLAEALAAEHVRGARARGVPERRITRRALRLATVPLLVAAAADLPLSLSNALIVDYVYGYGGLGSLLISFDRANGRTELTLDPAVFLAVVVALAVLVVVANTLADVAVSVLDPRVRLRS